MSSRKSERDHDGVPPLTDEEIKLFRAGQERERHWKFFRQVCVAMIAAACATISVIWGARDVVKAFIKALIAASK